MEAEGLYIVLTQDGKIKRHLSTIMGEYPWMIQQLLCNLREKAAGDENLNMTLETIFKNIEESAKGSESEDHFTGLFDDIDVNSNKLGATVASATQIS